MIEEEEPLLKYEIIVTGDTFEDIDIALQEVKIKISEGYTSGFDENESGSYSFEEKCYTKENK